MPEESSYRKTILAAISALQNEPIEIRPRDGNGLPGGLVLLKRDGPVVLVPDLHGRVGFFRKIMEYVFDGGLTVGEGLERGTVQVVCLGDGFHGEARAALRWREAHREYLGGYGNHRYMDEEMEENFALMEMVMKAKTAYPENFHFLKGNHENISNEDGNGNYSFGKFVNEGEMVALYVKKFFTSGFLRDYYTFEKSLPLFAVGGNFLVSHAEPGRFFSQEEIINYREHPEVIYGLTWTDNGEALCGSVQSMLKAHLEKGVSSKAYYFGGHRPVSGLYALRAGGKFVQFHNPSRSIIALIRQSRDIDLKNALIDLNAAAL